jgi:hypothetical protein
VHGGELVCGQVHVDAVEVLGLVRAGQADQHDDGLGSARGLHRLRMQRVVVGGVPDAVSRGERDVLEGRGQLVKGVLDPGGVDLRAAGALVAGSARELADHGDPVAGRQRQNAALVFQQDDRLRGGGPGQLVVGVGVELLVHVEHRHASVDQLEDGADPGVEHPLVQLTGAHGGDDLLRAARQVRRHLQVQPRLQRRDPVVDRAPVGHDQPREAPLVAQHGGQQPGVL